MTRSVAGATIQLRVSGHLHAKLEALRARLEAQGRAAAKAEGRDPDAVHVSQSAVVRTLLESACETPESEIASRETLSRVYQKIHAAMANARETVTQAILAEFEEG